MKPYLWAALSSACLILLVNGSVLGLSVILGHPIAVRMADEVASRPVGWSQIIPESFVMPIVGVLLFWLFQKIFSRAAWPVFIVFSVGVTAVWSSGPIQHGVDGWSRIALTGTHGVILCAILFFLFRWVVRQPK